MNSPPQFLLGRQPILDRRGTTVAYELLFRTPGGGGVTDDRMATATVIAHAFSELGLAAVLGNCRGFINFDAELLLSDAVELLPPQRTAIELLETVQITPEIVERCRELHGKGFSFALDDIVQVDESLAPLLPFIDVIKVDLLQASAADLGDIVRQARRHGVQLLAEKVDSHEQARRCHELGFDLFQGYFFARPVVLQGRRADPSKRILLQLLQRILTDCETEQIEMTFKHSPELSYKLMRLVNSVGIGLREPIRSLSHALVILGRRQLQRWLQVLLFANASNGDFPSPLLIMATSRARLMELLAEKNSPDANYSEQAFMTGILSLLDVILDAPMSEVIGELNLPGDVKEALLARTGRLGGLLQLAEALERDDAGAANLLRTADRPCETAELPQLHISAMAFSNAVADSMNETGEAPPARASA